MKLRAIFLLLVSTLIVGCAGGVKPMAPETAASVSESKVALAYFYPRKQMNYDELVYKVLWNEVHSNSVSFKGLWDIDRELTRHYQQQFKQVGLDVVPADELLAPELYQRLGQDVTDHLTRIDNSLKQNQPAPVFKLAQEQRQALSEQGVPYLLLIVQSPVKLSAYSLMNKLSLISGSDVKIYATATGEVQFDGDALMWLNHDYEKSPREIEANNLKLFKELMATGVDVQFKDNQLPKKMGLVQ